MKYDFKQLFNLMYGLYCTAWEERESLRQRFNEGEYEWHVPSEIYDLLQKKMLETDRLTVAELYSAKPITVYGIKVVYHPLSNDIELTRRIGGIEL